MKKYLDNLYLLLLLNSIVALLFILPRLLIPASLLLPTRNVLAVIVAYTLRFHLLLILAFLMISIKPLFDWVKRIKPLTWIALILVFIFGIYQFWFVGPYTHRVYFDEDIYLNIASNIALQGQATKTNFGTPTQCFEGEYNKDPSGMPALVSVFFQFLGVNEYLGSRVTVIISSLSILLVFLISFLLFGSEILSLFAAFIFTILPENVIWAPTVAAEPYIVFFAGITLLGILLYARTRENKALFLALLGLAYTAQVRPEGVLLLLPIEAYLCFDLELEKKLNEKGFVAAWTGFFILLLPQFFNFGAFRGEGWGATGVPMFGLMHFINNFRTNLWYFFENTRWPVLVTVLAIFGIFPFRKWLREKALLGTMILVFFSVFLFFYAGSYNYGTDVRFSLILNIPLVIFAAAGLVNVNSALNKWLKPILINPAWLLIFLISYRLVYPSIPIMEESIDSRSSHDYMVQVIRELPPDSYLLSYDPCIVAINGRSGSQATYAVRKEVMDKIFSKTDNVYFYQDIWSQIPPYKDQWKNLLTEYDLERIKGMKFRSYNFDLYRVRKKLAEPNIQSK
jgi:hypothetical protein